MSKLKIDSIVVNAGTQFRASTNEAKVTEYAALLSESKAWPFDTPCEVFFDGLKYYLVDGFHRYLAAQRAERKEVDCNVRNGSLRDAIKFALGANARHGLHRSNEDKRKAVTFVLDDEEWSKLSSRMIADICGVSPAFVDSNRKVTANERQSNETRIGKDGRETVVKKSQPVAKKPATQQPTATKGDEPLVFEDVDDEPQKPIEKDTPAELAAHIENVGKRIDELIQSLKKYSDLPGGEWLDMATIETDGKRWKHEIRSARYWRDCMVCKGKGCKTCKNRGWLSHARKEFLTQEEKDLAGI